VVVPGMVPVVPGVVPLPWPDNCAWAAPPSPIRATVAKAIMEVCMMVSPLFLAKDWTVLRLSLARAGLVFAAHAGETRRSRTQLPG
jgi:hypothetical protein